MDAVVGVVGEEEMGPSCALGKKVLGKRSVDGVWACALREALGKKAARCPAYWAALVEIESQGRKALFGGVEEVLDGCRLLEVVNVAECLRLLVHLVLIPF